MRYVLPESQKSEITGRLEYLYDVFHLFFVPSEVEDGWISLLPFGKSQDDILFIVGHSKQVIGYLDKNIDSITESVVVVTTCFPRKLYRFGRKKNLYVPNITGCECTLYQGSSYGFDFPITDAELDMYNATGDIIERIRAGYRKV